MADEARPPRQAAGATSEPSTEPPPIRRSGSPFLERRGRAALADKLPPPEHGRWDPARVAFAARAWTLKAEEEYRSAAVFAEVVAGCLDLGAPLDVVAALARIVEDEIAHAALCHDLAARYGAPPPRAAMDRVRARVVAHAADRTRQALALLLFEGAVGETISVALFRKGQRATREPCARAALGLIARDEARHATVCWRAAAALLPSCPEATRELLADDLSHSFGALEQGAALPALRKLEAGGRVDPEVVELGVLTPEARVEAFYKAIERGALPRLARLGFDAARIWEARYRVGPTA